MILKSLASKENLHPGRAADPVRMASRLGSGLLLLGQSFVGGLHMFVSGGDWPEGKQGETAGGSLAKTLFEWVDSLRAVTKLSLGKTYKRKANQRSGLGSHAQQRVSRHKVPSVYRSCPSSTSSHSANRQELLIV